MRYLYHDKGLRGEALLKKFPKFSRRSIYRHASKPLGSEPTLNKRKFNAGRPRKLSI